MTFDKIMQDLKAKKYKPIYFLMGDEPYFIDIISNYIIKNVLTEQEKAFNQLVLYGKDVDVATIDNTARRFPMMADYQVIIVKEAQDVKKIEDLVYYAQKPQKSTILVLNYKYKTLDKRKKVYKEIEKNGIILNSGKLYENKIPAWIDKYVKEKGFKIEPVASALLTEFLGTNLSKIANELDKLIIILPKNTKITTTHIQDNIGISKDYNNFELQKALIKKDPLKANKIINYFGQNPKDNPIILTITSLYGLFSKILTVHYIKNKNPQNIASVLKVNPYFVKDYIEAAKAFPIRKTVEIISHLREYDLKSKGLGNVSTNQTGLLQELVFKILH